MKKVFVYDAVNAWGATTNEQEAKQHDPTYKLATIDDLHTFVACSGHAFQGELLTADGIVQWYEQGDYDDYHCEYRLIG